jgi:hypothetical protein
MLQMFSLNILWLGVLLGWGRFWVRLTGCDTAIKSMGPVEQLAFTVLLGHLPVATLGYIFHLGWGLGAVVSVPIICLGLMMGLRKSWTPVLPLLIGVGFFVAIFCSRLMIHGDSGGYHTQAILWMVEEPVVRGLANLMTPLGYNSAWWMLAALMSWPAGAPVGAGLVSAPLMTAVGLLILAAAKRIVQGNAHASDWFWIPGFYLWLRQVVGVNTPSPTTDIPANLLTLTAIALLVQHAEKPYSQIIARPLGRVFLSIAFLAATSKLSSASLLAMGIIWLSASWIFQLCERKREIWGNIWRGALYLIPVGISGIVFLFHGWLLSGWPLFPSTIGGVQAPSWMVPRWLVEHTAARAKAWAFSFGATPEQIASTPGWKLWVEGQNGATNLAIVGAACVIACLTLIYLLKKRKLSTSCLIGLFWPATISMSGLVWSLWQIPALRFASGYAFSTLGIAAVIIVPSLGSALRRLLPVVWLCLCVLALGKLAISRSPAWIKATPPQKVEVQKVITTQGYTVNIPVDGFPWFSERPCSLDYEFDPDLKVLFDRLKNQPREFRNGKEGPN